MLQQCLLPHRDYSPMDMFHGLRCVNTFGGSSKKDGLPLTTRALEPYLGRIASRTSLSPNLIKLTLNPKPQTLSKRPLQPPWPLPRRAAEQPPAPSQHE